MAQQLDSNLTKAEQYLAKYRNQTLGHYIAGEWSLGSEGETFENYHQQTMKALVKLSKAALKMSIKPVLLLNLPLLNGQRWLAVIVKQSCIA